MIKNGLALLTTWLESNGYTVNLYSNTSMLDPKTKVVSISNGSTPIQKLYTLAHEAGHLCLYKSRKYKVDYSSIQYAENVDARHGHSRLYRYKKLQEEINAWESGYKLMTRLGIKVKKDAYDFYAARWVGTYIKFLANNTSPAE